MKYLILLFCFLNLAVADTEIDYKFRPDYWSKGLHLMAGGGLNFSHFQSDRTFNHVGYGLNFKTDLGYYFTNRFAVEWSSSVKFNRVNQFLIWDTLITGGIRYRINEYFIRAFFGKGPSVVFFNGHAPAEFKGTRVSRLQFDGPVFGLALGKMFQKKSGLNWFIETSGTFQRLDEREGIHMNGQTPEVVSHSKDKSTVLSINLVVGLVVF